MPDPNLVGLCGALRRDSTNRKLLQEAARLFGPSTFKEVDLNFPLYHGDHEAAEGVPLIVQEAADLIAQADAIVITTPEYNKGLSGVLKNALDWISRVEGNPWRDKPVALMSAAAGRSGGERAQAMLRQCLVAFRPRVLHGPEVHLASSSSAFEADGTLSGELYLKTLQELMESLRAEVAR